jgi:hypothetical protein
VFAGILALAAAMGIGRFAYTPILPAMLDAGGLDTARQGFSHRPTTPATWQGALAADLAVRPSAQGQVARACAVVVVAATTSMAVTTGLAAWNVVRFVAGLGSAGSSSLLRDSSWTT